MEEAAAGAPWVIQLQDIKLSDITLCHSVSQTQQRLCAKFDQLSWNGNVALNQPISPQVSGDFLFSAFQLMDLSQQQVVVQHDEFAINQLAINGLEDIQLEQVKLTDLKLLPNPDSDQQESKPAVFHLAQLAVNNTSFAELSQLTIEQILLQGIGADIVRNQQALWAAEQQLTALLPPASNAVEKEPITSEPEESEDSHFNIQLGQLLINNGQAIHFSDQSLASPFAISASIDEIDISNIDLAAPDNTTDIKLAINTEDGAKVVVEGELTSLATLSDFDFSGDISALDLRPAGTYLQDDLGSNIKSGQLSANLLAKASDGALDGKLGLDLQQLQLKSTAADSEALNQLLGLPVDKALNLLRDRDNSIKLDIPIDGDINSPEFDTSKIITKALSKVLIDQVIKYYTPYGLVTVTEGLLDLRNAMLFDPVVFTAGSDQLTQPQTEQLNNIEEILLDRPQIAVTLCGYSNLGDAEALGINPETDEDGNIVLSSQQQQQVQQLADSRSSTIKSALMDRGIAAEKLIVCASEFDQDQISGVEVSI